MSSDKKPGETASPSKRQLVFLSWTKDILIYTTVLNLFVEFNPKIIIDSFTISIFTAILLKILLEVILKLEHKVAEALKGFKFLRILIMWLILFGSKFLILEVIDLVFGTIVDLGKFWDIIFLIIVMMIAREVFQRIFHSLGNRKDNAA